MSTETTEMRRERQREYMRQRREAIVHVYFKDAEERRAFAEGAKAAGYLSFSKWIVQTLHNSAAGLTYPAGYVPGLEADLKKYRELVRTKDEQIAELHQDVRLAETARDDAVLILKALADKLPEAHAQLRALQLRWQLERSAGVGRE